MAFTLPQTGEAFRFILGRKRVDQFAQPRAFEHFIELVQRQVNAVVGDPALGEIIGADAFRTVARADHRLARAGALARQPLALELEQPRAQHLERLGLVLVLRFLVLLDDDQAGRQVGDADRTVGGVDRLAAGPGRAIDVDAQILVVDLDVDILGLGQNRDRRRRSVDASAAFGHRHALDAMDAAFELQAGEDAGTADRCDGFLVAADLGGAGGDQLELPALGLGIALIHAQQVAGEQSGLIAAGAGANLEHRGSVVGGVAREQLDRQRALGVGQPVADVVGLGRRHLLQLKLGGRVGDHAV